MNIAHRPVGFRDHGVGFAMATAFVFLLAATANDLGMSRDESFYVISAERYAAWFEELWKAPEAALDQTHIDGAWGVNHEHPSLVKSFFAFGWLAQRDLHVFSTDSLAFRFFGMVSSGLLLWLIYIFGARVYGRRAGAFAAMAFAFLPRPFYHAHLDAFDMPITTVVVLVTYAYYRSLEKPVWAIWVGVTFGLALETKHNSWVLPGIYFIHWLWVAVGEVRRRRLGQRTTSLVPYWLIGMLVLGPPIFIGLWPWLWHDTVARIREYVAFHLHHDYYNMEYFGVTYFRPPFPMSYPFVMTLFTVPLTTLGLCFAGIVVRAPKWVPGPLFTRIAKSRSSAPDPYAVDILNLGSLLAPIVIIALPSTPIFGGTKHWFPAYPFLSLFAGVGFARVLDSIFERFPSVRRFRVLVSFVVATALLSPSIVETAHAHPFALSHYTAIAGGVPGAAEKGMNRQFWGFTTGSLTEYFKQRMPNGGTVYLCDTTWDAWRMLQRDGRVPDNIQGTFDLVHADYVMVHHETHFNEVDYQAWEAFGSARPDYVLLYDGVPIITVYKNPRSGRR